MSVSGGIHRLCSRYLGPLARNPVVTLITGLGLFVSGMIELLEETIEGFEHFIGMHHGVILLGIVGIMRGFSESMEGVEWLVKPEEEGEGGETRERPEPVAGAGAVETGKPVEAVDAPPGPR